MPARLDTSTSMTLKTLQTSQNKLVRLLLGLTPRTHLTPVHLVRLGRDGLELTTKYSILQWMQCNCPITSLMSTKSTPTIPEGVQRIMFNPDSAQTRDLIPSAPMPPKCGMPYQLSLRHVNPLTPSKQLSRVTYGWLQFETDICKNLNPSLTPVSPHCMLVLFPYHLT